MYMNIVLHNHAAIVAPILSMHSSAPNDVSWVGRIFQIIIPKDILFIF